MTEKETFDAVMKKILSVSKKELDKRLTFDAAMKKILSVSKEGTR